MINFQFSSFPNHEDRGSFSFGLRDLFHTAQ